MSDSPRCNTSINCLPAAWQLKSVALASSRGGWLCSTAALMKLWPISELSHHHDSQPEKSTQFCWNHSCWAVWDFTQLHFYMRGLSVFVVGSLVCASVERHVEGQCGYFAMSHILWLTRRSLPPPRVFSELIEIATEVLERIRFFLRSRWRWK